MKLLTTYVHWLRSSDLYIKSISDKIPQQQKEQLLVLWIKSTVLFLHSDLTLHLPARKQTNPERLWFQTQKQNTEKGFFSFVIEPRRSAQPAPKLTARRLSAMKTDDDVCNFSILRDEATIGRSLIWLVAGQASIIPLNTGPLNLYTHGK